MSLLERLFMPREPMASSFLEWADGDTVLRWLRTQRPDLSIESMTRDEVRQVLNPMLGTSVSPADEVKSSLIKWREAIEKH